MSRTHVTDAPPPGDPEGSGGKDAGRQTLSNGLKQRHLSMIALGGVIGAGLFVGSGEAIRAAGPSVIIAYATSGLIVMLVMRMLGEMSAARPASGSFSVHAERALGPWAGFASGWIYWVTLCVAIAAEAIAASDIMVGWISGGPDPWVWVLLFMTVFCGSNLVAVRNFGESEFWFAALKVFAITAFLLLGLMAIIGLLPGTEAPGGANLNGEGGFLPEGTNGLIIGLLASVFAYGGLETVTIAAAESEDPVRGVAKAVRTTVWRIAIFYVGSMIVIVTLIPWHEESVTSGPYAAVLKHIGIPAAGEVMNVVILVALLSAMNANIYGASRMAYSLVSRGEGPAVLGRLSRMGVPWLTVIASSAFGFVAVLLKFQWETSVFQWLLNMVGATTLVVWGFITVSQVINRYRLEREAPERLVVRMWLFPGLSVATLVGIVSILLLMLRQDNTRTQLVFTAGLTAALVVIGLIRQRLAPPPPPTAEAAAASDAPEPRARD
ncbi:amino acid permease [Streptomyces sp. AJS327]|uniref:amino acid permease n=1 Tax=Streptomyces sp. AJS327 TaxID=2545265 RepID=UPI0015DFF810|nr:amino acid permease [Streptomyces sp. AJS327]MBA0049819.1 amino acid permease [Streptomyces sp. AJS327]